MLELPQNLPEHTIIKLQVPEMASHYYFGGSLYPEEHLTAPRDVQQITL